MTHISPLIFSSIQLVDPIMTGIIAWIAGIEGIPDLYTWIGGFVVISGVALITYGEHQRSHTENNENEIKCGTDNNNAATTTNKKNVEMKSNLSTSLDENSIDETETVLLCEDEDNLSLLIDEKDGRGSTDVEKGQLNNRKIDDEEEVEEMLLKQYTIKIHQEIKIIL